MGNILSTYKQIAVISALSEGSSIRSIERITGVHRDTIMRLGVKIGQGGTALMDETMRDLPCTRLELDEIWGFIGKKRENFEAAVGLQFAYYNFVKRHNTLCCTPAMAAGVTPGFWSVGDLVEAAG